MPRTRVAARTLLRAAAGASAPRNLPRLAAASRLLDGGGRTTLGRGALPLGRLRLAAATREPGGALSPPHRPCLRFSIVSPPRMVRSEPLPLHIGGAVGAMGAASCQEDHVEGPEPVPPAETVKLGSDPRMSI